MLRPSSGPTFHIYANNCQFKIAMLLTHAISQRSLVRGLLQVILELKTTGMKTTILVLCLFCVAGATAQTAPVIPSRATMVQVPDNPQHASQHDLATEHSLLEHSTYTYAQGERPLWEFGPISQPVPLGDVARAYRTQHALAKKAEVILNK